MTLPPVPFTALASRDNASTPLPGAATATGWFSNRRGGVLAVTLTGEIDLMVEPELLSLVSEFRAGRCAVATVDLRAVTFFGSTGLNFLSWLQQAARDRSGSLTVTGASPLCLRTLALVGLEGAFDLVA